MEIGRGSFGAQGTDRETPPFVAICREGGVCAVGVGHIDRAVSVCGAFVGGGLHAALCIVAILLFFQKKKAPAISARTFSLALLLK